MVSKMAEFCGGLYKRAPECSEEARCFADAADRYAWASELKNRGPDARRAQAKARRLYLKGWELRDKREALNSQKKSKPEG